MPAVLLFSLSYPTRLQVSLEALEEGVCSRTCLVVTTCLVDVSPTLAKRDTCHKICGTISFLASHWRLHSLQVHVFSKCRVMATWESMSFAFHALYMKLPSSLSFILPYLSLHSLWEQATKAKGWDHWNTPWVSCKVLLFTDRKL